jgi:hypothetical protein
LISHIKLNNVNISDFIYMKHDVILCNTHVACCRVRIVLDSLTTGITVLNLVLTWMYILTFSEFFYY